MSDQPKTTASNPELGINVFDLGMVYGQQLHEDGVLPLDMTLTSAACPYTDDGRIN